MKFLLFWKVLLGRFVGTWILLGSMWTFNWTSPQSPGEVPESWPLRDERLRTLGAAADLHVGAAVNVGQLLRDEAFQRAVTSQFDMVVAENAMKFKRLHPHPTTFAFDRADAFVDFAAKHQLKVRGHTLIWYGTAKWVRDGEDWDRESLLAVMENHITTVVGHFRGRVHYWDVVNEAISGYWGLRRNVWTKNIGEDFIDRAFWAAHRADPEAQLFYNDFRVEGLNPKADRLYRLVRDLKARGVPVHGVGLQGHMHFSLPSRAKLIAHLERLASLGVEIHFTEVDLGIPEPVTNGKRIKQAIRYHRLMDACLAVPACTAVVFWGVRDSDSWIPKFFKTYQEPLLFDEQFQPKLSYFAVLDALAQGRPASP